LFPTSTNERASEKNARRNEAGKETRAKRKHDLATPSVRTTVHAPLYLEDRIHSVEDDDQIRSASTELNSNHPHHREDFSKITRAVSHELLVRTIRKK
jgi:hypothetical protein